MKKLTRSAGSSTAPFQANLHRQEEKASLPQVSLIHCKPYHPVIHRFIKLRKIHKHNENEKRNRTMKCKKRISLTRNFVRRAVLCEYLRFFTLLWGHFPPMFFNLELKYCKIGVKLGFVYWWLYHQRTLRKGKRENAVYIGGWNDVV